MAAAWPLWWHFCHYVCRDIGQDLPEKGPRENILFSKYNPLNHAGRISRTDGPFRRYLPFHPRSPILVTVMESVSSLQRGFSSSPLLHISSVSLVFLTLHTKLLLCTCCLVREAAATQPLGPAPAWCRGCCSLNAVGRLPLLRLTPPGTPAGQEPHRLHGWEGPCEGHQSLGSLQYKFKIKEIEKCNYLSP